MLVCGVEAAALPFRSAAQLTLQRYADGSALLAAIRGLQLPAGEGFCWFAGEASVAAQVRDAVFADKGHPRDAGCTLNHEDL